MPQWVRNIQFDLRLEIAGETELTNMHLFECIQYGSDLSAMFLLERQHMYNKLEWV